MNSTKVSLTDKEDALIKSIASLEKAVRKQNSLKHLFLRGVVTGVASALGASLIAGIVVVWLLKLVQTIDYIPFIKGLIDSQEIQESLKNAFSGS